MASDFAGGEVFARSALKSRSRPRKAKRRSSGQNAENRVMNFTQEPIVSPAGVVEAHDLSVSARELDGGRVGSDAQGAEGAQANGSAESPRAAQSAAEDCPISLRDIVRRVGGDLYEDGKVALVPAPGQSRLTRGLVLRLAPDSRSIIWEALQKCSRKDIEAYLQYACGASAKA